MENMKSYLENLVFKESVKILINVHGMSKKEAEKLMTENFNCVQKSVQKTFASKKKYLD